MSVGIGRQITMADVIRLKTAVLLCQETISVFSRTKVKIERVRISTKAYYPVLALHYLQILPMLTLIRNSVKSMQVPFTFLFQVLSIGVHWKILIKKAEP
jgi:hypothetical protein